MNKGRFSAVAFAAACLVAVCSCTKEQLPTGVIGRRFIEPVISSFEEKTKSPCAAPEGRYIGSYAVVGGEADSLYISVYEYDNTDLPYGLAEEEPLTKGRVLTTESINATGQQFTLDAWLESTNRYDGSQDGDEGVYITTDKDNWHIIDGVTVERGSSGWGYTSGLEYPWRNQVATNFWSVYPVSVPSRSITRPTDSATDAQQKALTFSYALPAACTSAPYTDAENQPDLCFAYNTKTWEDGDDNKVNIEFQHALSAVYLDITGLDGSFTSIDVAFRNVYRAGACAVAGSGTNSVGFDWPSADLSDKGDVRQTFDVSSSSADFATSEGKRIQKFNGMGGSDKIFMMIPQPLPDDALLDITVRRSDNSTLDTPITPCPIAKLSNGNSVVWKPGKRYLYKISKGDPEEYDWNFVFGSHSNNSSDNKVTWRSYDNTTKNSARTTIRITSTRKKGAAAAQSADWVIESVQIGSGSPQPVPGDGTSYSNASGDVGLSVAKVGSDLAVTALARTALNKSSNSYWRNGLGRTDLLDWSPEDWSGRGVIDLSRYDFQTEDTDAPMISANCYVIRHAGTYKLPLVYGNAIDARKGGNNTQAYTSTMADGGDASAFLSNFKNHLDNNITGPFIENHASCAVSDVEVIWQDEAEVIDNLHLVGESSTAGYNTGNVRYLQFSVPQETVRQNNAIIAVTDTSGTVIWSWHIWITNDPGLLKPAIPVKNQADITYNFFPLYCLGWLEPDLFAARNDIVVTLRQKMSNETIALTVRQPEVRSNLGGCHYQFGRKDPICHRDDPFVDGKREQYQVGVGKVSLGAAIRNPGIFYNPGSSSGLDWCQPESGKTSYYNLWSGGYCGTGIIEGSQDGLHKTIYDPSPRGYMMPASNAFSGFTLSGAIWDKGYTFPTGIDDNTIFFPAAGCRLGLEGMLNYCGTEGVFWSAVPHSESNGRCMSLMSGIVIPSNFNIARFFGISARPVQE